MSVIRETVQETGKRIKQLGERSQEISHGYIVMTDMTNTNESNRLIADELEEVALIFSMLEKNNLIQALQTIDKELTRIDTLSQEHDATALRAISHWMGLNLELTDETKAQIETLLQDGSFSNWVDILASVLRKHDPVLLPQLHQSFTTPQWPIKPSAPLLKSIAMWIEEARQAQQVDEVTPESKDVSSSKDSDSEAETAEKSSSEDNEEFEQKHVFEEIDLSILNKDYNYCTDAVLKELKEHPDFKVSLIEVDKKGLSDDQEQTDHVDHMAAETEIEDQLESEQSMFAMEVDDIVMTLSASSSNSATPLENIEPYTKELSRLTQLAEISNYEGVSHASDWCQRNLKLFSENQNETVEHFIKTG
ncbi:hypothetical protein GQR58_006868 [Nymphon striatum]|nr:hypothetical protein GQR58_006868 [Nymphon striatum]